MTDDSAPRRSVEPEDLRPRGGPSRRTIITAGAWAVPAIVLATAAPAAAVSLNKKLNFTNFSVWYEWNSQGQRVAVSGNTTVFLTGDAGASVNLVTLVLSLPATDMAPTATVDADSPGWTFASAASDGTSMTYTFTWAGGTLVAGGAAYTSRLTFHLQSTGAITGVGRTWLAVASASGADPATATGGLSPLNPTAAVGDLTITSAGTLTFQSSPRGLHWDGAEIAFAGGVEAAHVPYSVRLYRDDVVVAALTGSAVDVEPGQSAPVQGSAYDDPAPGTYHVELFIVGTDGVKSAASPQLVVP